MKFKQTINVKKFISILLCTIFISSILPSNLLNCTVFATDTKKEPCTNQPQIYPPEIIEPKNICFDSSEDERKLYMNNTEQNGVKKITVIGLFDCKITIINNKDNTEIGSGKIPTDSCECTITLNDNFTKLEDGKEYPLSIYQELDSQTKSEPLNVTLCICNNLPTITAVTYNDKKDVTNKKIVEKTGSTILTVKAEGVITKKPLTTPYLVVDADEEGNSPFEKDEDSLKANGWAICSETCQISTSKNNPKARRFVYFKAKDDETGAIGLAKVIISFYKSM